MQATQGFEFCSEESGILAEEEYAHTYILEGSPQLFCGAAYGENGENIQVVAAIMLGRGTFLNHNDTDLKIKASKITS